MSKYKRLMDMALLVSDSELQAHDLGCFCDDDHDPELEIKSAKMLDAVRHALINAYITGVRDGGIDVILRHQAAKHCENSKISVPKKERKHWGNQ